MVVSLYISDIPKEINKEELAYIFKSYNGYKEIRMKVSNNDKRKIAFVDFETESEAIFAKNELQGYKFNNDDKGILLKFSDNNKNGVKAEKREPNQRVMLGRKRETPMDDRRPRSSMNNRSDDRYSNREKIPARERNSGNKYDPIQSINSNNNIPSSNSALLGNSNNQVMDILSYISSSGHNKAQDSMSVMMNKNMMGGNGI